MSCLDKICDEIGIPDKELSQFLFWGYNELFPHRKLENYLYRYNGEYMEPIKDIISWEFHRIARDFYDGYDIDIDFVSFDKNHKKRIAPEGEPGWYKIFINNIRKVKPDSEPEPKTEPEPKPEPEKIDTVSFLQQCLTASTVPEPPVVPAVPELPVPETPKLIVSKRTFYTFNIDSKTKINIEIITDVDEDTSEPAAKRSRTE
jgi:hypothetical protein